MATADYWSSADLKAIDFGGLINEDVMQQIMDISSIPLPFTSSFGSGSVSNSYYEWTVDTLSDPDTTNANVDGNDTQDRNDSKGGARVGNHAQISTKNVIVTTRARQSDSIGTSDELAKQVMRRSEELRRDVEAIMLTEQGSQADDGDTVPGLSAGLSAWLETNTSFGVGGADGGFSSGVVSATTPGTTRGLTETMVRDMAQSVWEKGGDPTKLMSSPNMIRELSNYMFTSSARIATLTSETTQSRTPSTAKGAVNYFLTDFDVILEMVPNRLYQPVVATPGSRNVTAFIYDPGYLQQAFLHGYRVEPLSKTGLADRRQMAVDWGLKVLNEEAHGAIRDLDDEVAVTL